jgi:transcriptional regulator with XRE-family HTH domain
MTEIGKRIKEIRNKRGLSQEDLAELSKVNLRTIQRIESNETTPREKTLRLIYDALEVEIIENKKYEINKYLIWSSILTLLIIVSTFLGWTRRFKMYLDGEKIYRTFTGWKGYTLLNDYDFYNWILSISSITLGLIVVSHSIGLIKNKFKYIVLQILILIVYVYGVIYWNQIQTIELRPGLFMIVITNLLLIRAYRKKDRKTGADNVYAK